MACDMCGAKGEGFCRCLRDAQMGRAKKIAHTVLSTAADKINPLLAERRRYMGLGNAVMQAETERTIDEVAGFRLDGKWIGAAEIDEALRLTRQAVAR